MSLIGIETLGGQAVEPLSRQPARSAVTEAFREIVEQMAGHLNAHRPLDTEAQTRVAVATQPMLSVPIPPRHGFSATGSSVLLDPNQPPLEQLPDDLLAENPLYNEREVVLRERLDLPAIERRLTESAAAVGIEFDRSDLEGILRNAGYGAAHLGSSERYMVAIEKFMGEAESRYLDRASNAPSSHT